MSDHYTDEPVKARITTDATLDGTRREWFLDGIDGEGGCTEACWIFDTFEEAVAALPQFWDAYLP